MIQPHQFREVDQIIAERVLGWKKHPCGRWTHNRQWHVHESHIPKPTRNIKSAMRVLDAMKTWQPRIVFVDDKWWCALTDPQNMGWHQAAATSLELAICEAVIHAVGEYLD